MKTIKTLVLCLTIISFFQCKKASSNTEIYTKNNDLAYNEADLNHPEKAFQNPNNKLITVPFMAENNRVVAAAALMPAGWVGKAWMDYSFYNTTILLNPKAQLSKGNSLFQFELTNWFSYSPQMQGFYDSFQTQSSQFQRKIGNLRQDAYELVINPKFSGYQIINEFQTNELFLRNNPNTQTYRVDLQNPQKPNHVTTVYVVRHIALQQNGITVWFINYSAVEGPKNKHKELLEASFSFANSCQFNPFYEQYIAQLNQSGLAHQHAQFNRQQKAIMGAYEHTSNVLQQMRESRNQSQTNHNQQFSDIMLDQTTYITANGNEITLPTTDEYTFSNGIGDFISTNNPLFDPNQTSSIHNWKLLQQKF